MWVLALACSGDKETTPPTDTDPPEETGTASTGDTAPPPGPDLVVLDEHVYRVTTSWTIASVDVREQYDALVSWSGLTTDAWGTPVAASSMSQLVFMEILLPPDQIPARLAADDLGTALISTWQGEVSGQVFANLTDLAYQTTTFDPAAFLLETAGKTWLLSLALSDGARLDLRTALLVTPVAGGPATIDVTNADSAYSGSATISGTPLLTAEGHNVYTVDWSGLTADALGKAYDEDRGDVLFVGRFDEAAADLGAQVLDLGAVAEAWWTMDVLREDDARLDLARDSTGAPFPGFSSGATWLVGVTCSTCLSPFPLWVAEVDVE